MAQKQKFKSKLNSNSCARNPKFQQIKIQLNLQIKSGLKSRMLLSNNKKLILSSTVEGDSPGTFMMPNSSPVGRVQEISKSIPENHPYDCQRIIPQLLSRIQKLETIVISLMIERVTKVGKNMDHSHLVFNEATCDSEGFSTLIQLSQEEEAYCSPLCLPTSNLSVTANV